MSRRNEIVLLPVTHLAVPVEVKREIQNVGLCLFRDAQLFEMKTFITREIQHDF